MDITASTPPRDQFRLISFVPFLLITFGIAWGIIALYIVLPDQMSGIFGQLSGNHPLFFLAVYAPAIAAFSIIFRKTGINGLRRYLSRLFMWRCSLYWYAFLIFVLPAVFYAGAAWKGTLSTEPFPFSSAGAVFTALILSIIKGPIEEFGWRGFAQPLLQRRMAPIWAALIIGVVWGLWHLPAFMLSGTQQSAWSFSAFFGGTVAISLIMTPLYNSSKGSILIAAIMHFQLMNPIWPDAQPYDTYILIVIAVVVVGLNWKSMFGRDGSSTEIIPHASVI